MFWENFTELCKKNGKMPTQMALKMGFSSSNVTAWKNGRLPRRSSLEKIADFFNVSVDYLLCGRDINQTIKDNHGIIAGQANAPITIVNNDKKLSEEEKALIAIYNKLDVIKRANLLSYASELAKE